MHHLRLLLPVIVLYAPVIFSAIPHPEGACDQYRVPLHNSLQCRDITPYEILRSMKWLVTEQKKTNLYGKCDRVKVLSGHTICMDKVNTNVTSENHTCVVYIIHGNCEKIRELSSLAEYWLKSGCIVRHIVPIQESCTDTMKESLLYKQYTRRISLHNKIPNMKEVVDVLILEDFEGRGMQALSALYRYNLLMTIKQFSLHMKFGCVDLKNSEVGASRGWAFWSMQYHLRRNGFAPILVSSENGSPGDRPNCFSDGMLHICQRFLKFCS